MENSALNKIDGSRRAIVVFFIFFGFIELVKLLVTKDMNLLSISPILTYFFISVVYIFITYICNDSYLSYNIVEFNLISIIYTIYTGYNFIFSFVAIHVNSFSDIHFYLSITMLFFLFLGFVIGNYFIKKRDLRSIDKEIIIRGCEIEVKYLNPWSELSFDKIPWLRTPFKRFGKGVGLVFIFVGGSAAGLSIAIAEGLKRSGILGTEIDIHAFLFFTIGVPISLAVGVIIAPLVSYLSRWRRLITSIKNEYGSYVVFLNLDKKTHKS